MSDPVLHIKDSYYFEIPKALLPAHYKDKSEFPNVWVKNDDQFQEWEAERQYHGLQGMVPDKAKLPDEHDLIHQWEHWQHAGANHENFAKPLDVYLETLAQNLRAEYNTKYGNAPIDTNRPSFDRFLDDQETDHAEGVWFARLTQGPEGQAKWRTVKEHAGSKEAIAEFKKDSTNQWSEQKLAAYNDHLSGKILLEPQPFGELRNLYEAESGFCISKYMVVEVVGAVLLFVLFSWLAGKARAGTAPRGRLWNFLEVFLVFIRDQVARPAIGAHHDEHEAEHAHSDPTRVHEGKAIGGAGLGGAPAEVDDIHGHHHGKMKHDHHHNPYADADRFVPLLWTIFFFVLTCNLLGLIPWVGSPTASWGATFALALVTFATVVIAGMLKFGFLGFLANQVPSMDLPWYMAIILKPMIFAIEMMGLLIKHLVLSIRLLANMVAGHLVILGVMGLAFGAEAALSFSAPGVAGWQWWLVATIAVVGSVLFNILELFVAFLQAYVFTFLSALFIGAAVHKH